MLRDPEAFDVELEEEDRILNEMAVINAANQELEATRSAKAGWLHR